jgi:hypothetical protein
MRKPAVLIGMAAVILGFILLSPSTALRDAGLLAITACAGVYVSWTLPLEGD